MSFARSLKESARKVWEDCYNHPFVQEMGKGTLPKEKFLFYLQQDYVYLMEYARVFAMGAIKAKDEDLMTRFTTLQHGLLTGEMELHRHYMRDDMGIDLATLKDVKQSLYNNAYTSNMMSVAVGGDAAEILAVGFPCAWSYGEFATRLKEDYADCLEGNYYKTWIESYAGTAYGESYQWFFDCIDKLCAGKTEKELDRLREIFRVSTQFEYLFWDMSYNMQMDY